MAPNSSAIPPFANSLTLDQLQDWKLEDAKAGLSEVVRLAQEQAPQKITVLGKDAVVVISAKEFMKLSPSLNSRTYIPYCQNRPLVA
jgi:antitoxin Phd